MTGADWYVGYVDGAGVGAGQGCTVGLVDGEAWEGGLDGLARGVGTDEVLRCTRVDNSVCLSCRKRKSRRRRGGDRMSLEIFYFSRKRGSCWFCRPSFSVAVGVVPLG